MTAKRFPSKIDRWILVVLLLALLVQAVAFGAVIFEGASTGGLLVIAASTLLLFGLIGSTLRFTYYEVQRDTLKVVCGPFRWRVPIADIESVEPTRNPLSSPALSLDRLKIRYGKRKVIMVSPADKKGFLKAINQGTENREQPERSGE